MDIDVVLVAVGAEVPGSGELSAADPPLEQGRAALAGNTLVDAPGPPRGEYEWARRTVARS